MLDTVKVPEQFASIFEKAQEYVGRYFREKKEDPSKGTIEIFGERYILVRAASMSVEFFETIANLYEKEGKEEAANIARQLLFDMAHAIGRQDARNFHKKMDLKDPVEKLSAGPIHFSHAGWAFVDIFPESRPSPDESYYLIYDHPYAFESAAWIASGKKSDFPVCIMNAGYSSGWCEESFGITLVASEIMCQAKGDDACRFIMAPPSRIEGHIADYMKRKPELVDRITRYEVPGFFKRKEMEDELKKANDFMNVVIDAIPSPFYVIDTNDYKVKLANAAFGSRDKWEGRTCYDVTHHRDEPCTGEHTCPLMEVKRTKRAVVVEHIHYDKDGRQRLYEVHGSPILDRNGNVTYMIEYNQDITERKKMEDSLKRANEELLDKTSRLERFQKVTLGREQRIMELKREVNELLERVGEAKRYK